MQRHRWVSGVVAALLWGAASAVAVASGLQLWSRAADVPTNFHTLPADSAALTHLDRLFGAPDQPLVADAQATPSAPFQLLGVVVQAPPQRSLALLGRPGRPARAVMLGDAVDEQWLLADVQPHQATLTPREREGDAPLVLKVPPPQPKTMSSAGGAPRGTPAPMPAYLPTGLPGLPGLPAAVAPATAAPSAPTPPR